MHYFRVFSYVLWCCAKPQLHDWKWNYSNGVMGVTVVLLPFTTSETTALFGNKKARFIGRILGMILIAVGIWVGFI